ncbi:MAG: protein kinase [Sandaracinaceae bacterium]|nr:protein kinase [Sandaracinaceae bacterium]
MSAELDATARAELERRIGAPHRLDGSFPSLWSLELLLRSVRRSTFVHAALAWVGPYVRGVIERAYRELGLTVVDLGPDLLSVERPGFVTNLAKAVTQMMSQRPPPEGSDLSPVLGMALAPRFGLEAVTLGMPLLRPRGAKHPQLLEPITAWLAAEHARATGLDARDAPIVRALVAPSFGYVASDGAEHVAAVRAILGSADPARPLLALAKGPDRYLAVIAARVALELGIAPPDAESAHAMRRACRHFALDPAIADGLPFGERPLEGADDPRYVEARRLEGAGDLLRAHALADELCRAHPDRAAGFLLRGTLAVGLGRDGAARADLDRAIELRPDHAAAWVERSELRAKTDPIEASEADLLVARSLRPDDDDMRARLVVSYLVTQRRGGAPAPAPVGAWPAPPPRPAPAPPPKPQPHLSYEREPDPYEIRETLGEGGMGKVFRVHHRGWGIDLALKIPRVELLERGGVQGFLEEAEAWAKLGSHPHTVDCHYVRMRDGVPWLFAELVEGGSLRSWIEDGRLYRPAPGLLDGVPRLVDVALMMAYGLQHAHDHDLIHQDMKPANVLLSTRGVAKVTDFGLAKVTQLAALPTSSDGHATMAAGFAGMTPLYCSPEQAAAARSKSRVLLTRRTDIWSWGLTVLEMFTGGPTWRSGVLAHHALARVRAATPRDIPAMPEGLGALLERCFLPDEADRPRTMDEVAAELRLLQESLTGEPARPKPAMESDVAGVLNNRAASLLDLGRPEDADAHWRRALAAEPLHLEATYNLALTRWRRGELTDLAALEAVTGARVADGGPEGHWLEAWLHHERASAEGAARAKELGSARAAAGVPEPPKQTPSGVGEVSLTGVEGVIRRLAVSADAKRVAVATEAGVSVHEGVGGLVIGRREGAVDELALGPEGRFAATAGAGRVTVWEVDTMAERGVSIDAVAALAPCGTGAFLVAAGDRVVLVERDGAARDLGRHDGAVRGVASARGGKLVASAGEDARVELRLRDGTVTRTLRHERAVDWVELSADGARALTGSWDAERAHYRLAVWDTASASLVRRFEEPASRRAALTDAGRQVVSWDERARLRLWRVRDGRCLRTEPREAGAAGDRLAWTSDADLGVRASGGGVAHLSLLHELPRAPIVLVRPEEDVVLAERAARVGAAIEALAGALDAGDRGAVIAATEALRALPGHRRHPRTAELVDRVVASTDRGPVRASFPGATRIDLSGPIVALAATADADVLAASWDEGRGVLSVRPRVFGGSADEGWEVDLDGSLERACASSDGALVAAVGGTLRRVDAEGAVTFAPFEDVRDLAIEGRRLFVAGGRGLAVWDLDAGAWEPSFPIDRVTDVSVAGDAIAIAAERGAPAVWSVSGRRPRRALYQEAGRRVELGPAGRKAACLLDDTVLVVDVDDPADVPAPRAIPVAGARAAAFADGDTLLAIGTRDGEVILVDLAHDPTPRLLGRHENAVRALLVSADGRTITTGGRDRSVRLWHVEHQRR